MRKINESLYIGKSVEGKPNLTPRDIGARFIETDTNVESSWNGSRWRTTESILAELLHYVVGGNVKDGNVIIKVGALLGTDITVDQAEDSITIDATLIPSKFIVPEGPAPSDGITPGKRGEMIWDGDMRIYVCVNETTKDWKRLLLVG